MDIPFEINKMYPSEVVKLGNMYSLYEIDNFVDEGKTRYVY